MNDEIFSALAKWECDLEGALERFLDDKELYLVCLQTLAEDSNFEKLGIALKEDNISKAFDYAHTLKGVFANLGLTPMLSVVETIVEPLRIGVSDNLDVPYKILLEQNEKLKEILGM